MSANTPVSQRVVDRVAALYDIHGNLPALDAVLAEIDTERPDVLLVGGDVLWGAMQAETIERLRSIADGALFIRGNCEREVIGRHVSGDEQQDAWTLWCADELSAAEAAFVASWPEATYLEIAGLGTALFCHGSPRSDEEIITSATSEPRLAAMLAGVTAPVVVCGHTHVQFDRRAAGHRVVNPGSVGMAYEGEPGVACWALLGPDVELRRTRFDVAGAAAAVRAKAMPHAEPFIRMALLEPAAAEEATLVFEEMAEQQA